MRIVSCLGAMVVFVLLLALPAQAVVPTTIWSDGFETGNFSAWTSATGLWDTTGQAPGYPAVDGSKYVDIFGANGSAPSILLLQKSTVGYDNLALEFYYRGREPLETPDYVEVSWTVDGTHWENISGFHQNNQAPVDEWTVRYFEFPATAANNPNFAIRVWAKLDAGETSDRVDFDCFALTGTPEPATLAILSVGMIPAMFRRRRFGR